MADEKLDAMREALVARLLEDMDALGANWVRPWVSQAPQNPSTGTVYQGRNALILGFVIRSEGYEDPRFMTFRQAQKMGLKVAKGCHGWPVERWGEVFFHKEKTGRIPQPRSAAERERYRRDPEIDSKVLPIGHYTVFNGSDIVGLEPFCAPDTMADTEARRTLVEGCPCELRVLATDSAFYSPMFDRIEMPLAASFTDEGTFLRCLLHEEVHATGAEGRLGRPGIVSGEGMGSESYAFEELVAELGSVFCASRLGIGLGELAAADLQRDGAWENHGAYLKGWLQALPPEERPRSLMAAATQAGRAADWLFEHRFSKGEAETAA